MTKRAAKPANKKPTVRKTAGSSGSTSTPKRAATSRSPQDRTVKAGTAQTKQSETRKSVSNLLGALQSDEPKDAPKADSKPSNSTDKKYKISNEAREKIQQLMWENEAAKLFYRDNPNREGFEKFRDGYIKRRREQQDKKSVSETPEKPTKESPKEPESKSEPKPPESDPKTEKSKPELSEAQKETKRKIQELLWGQEAMKIFFQGNPNRKGFEEFREKYIESRRKKAS